MSFWWIVYHVCIFAGMAWLSRKVGSRLAELKIERQSIRIARAEVDARTARVNEMAVRLCGFAILKGHKWAAPLTSDESDESDEWPEEIGVSDEI